MFSTFDKLESGVHLAPPITEKYAFETSDGVTFSTPTGMTNPIFVTPDEGGVGTTVNSQASSILRRGGFYWLAYEINVFDGDITVFGIAKCTDSTPSGNITATDLDGPWSHVADVTVLASPGYVWNPRWFVDDDDSVHIICNGQPASAGPYSTAHKPYMLDAQNAAFTSWSAATEITGTGLPSTMIDHFIMPKSVTPSGNYVIWFKHEGSKYLGYMESSSLKTGYTVTNLGDWLGVGQAEGPVLLKSGTTWRLYFDRFLATADADKTIWYCDSTDDWETWSTSAKATFPVRAGTGGFIVEG